MRTALVGLVVLVALLTLYVPHLREAASVFEDDRMLTVTGAPWTARLTGRGLTHESWQWVRTPGASHALNLALHGLTAFLVGLVLWQITQVSWIAGNGAALVALHPLSVESVAYATSRAELIAAVGALVAVSGVLRRWPVGLVLAAGGLWGAWLGKETGAVALLLLPLTLWVRRDRRLEDALWIMGGTVALTSALWWPYAITLPAIGEIPTAHIDPRSWGLIQASAVWRLVVLSVWPAWLSVSPDMPPSFWLGAWSAVLLAGLLESAWRARHQAPLFTFGVLWCAVVAAPRFIVRTPLSPFNEHQWYLALPGVACCVLAGIEALAAHVEQWRGRPCPA